MAHRIKTVGSGKDYETLSLALAGEAAADYVLTNDSTDEIDDFDIALEFQLYALTEAATITFPSFQTDVSHRILIRVMTGERHAGYWDATKYNLTVSGATALQCYTNYVIFDGMQMRGGAGSGQCLYVDGATNIQIRNSIIDGGSQKPMVALSGATIVLNNTLLQSTGALAELYSATSQLTALNCDFIGGFYQADGASVFKNCYASRPTDDGPCYYKAAGTMTWTTCASSDSTVRTGVTASVPFSTATFSSVNVASSAYVSPLSGSALAGVGTNLQADSDWTTGVVDLGGLSRLTWDIGARAVSGQWARPIQDVSVGTWRTTANGATNLYAEIDEVTASDAEYVRSGVAPSADTLVVELSDVTSPAAGVVRIHVRGRWL